MIVTGIPTLVAIVYFGLIASDIYVSEARFAVRSSKGASMNTGLAAVLSAPGLGGGSKETAVVTDYARSLDMLLALEDRFDLQSHYTDTTIDRLSRLDAGASTEERLQFFRDHVRLMHDSSSDVITLTVRAFDPQTAQSLAGLVIQEAELLVNELSSRMESDAITTARSEVERAVEKVRNASRSLMRFRRDSGSLDPALESSTLYGIASGLETRLAETRAELSETQAFMRDDSPRVVTLRNRINALERQLRIERGRIVGDSIDGDVADGSMRELGSLVGDYQPLLLEQELAQQQYASALASLELARVEAQRKKQYLVTFVQPSRPDAAVEPHRLNRILTVLVFSLLVYLVGGLMWSALKDHVGR